MLHKNPPKELYGIIGHPLGHTLSPVVHNWAFEARGDARVYMAWPTPPEKLESFVTAARTLPIRGVSVTIPHKVDIIPFLDGISDRSRKVGAVNTLLWIGDKLVGENTDVTGFLHPIVHGPGRGATIDTAIVLGSGGAARAAIAGLQEIGVANILIANRTATKAESLAESFRIKTIPWDERTDAKPDLIVNTTPLGMQGTFQDKTPWPSDAFPKGAIAYDMVYNPLPTRFLAEAEAAGCAVIDGMRMFVAQAVDQSRLWTGLEFPMDQAREVCLEALHAAPEAGQATHAAAHGVTVESASTFYGWDFK